jgi:hypothetical protein
MTWCDGRERRCSIFELRNEMLKRWGERTTSRLTRNQRDGKKKWRCFKEGIAHRLRHKLERQLMFKSRTQKHMMNSSGDKGRKFRTCDCSRRQSRALRPLWSTISAVLANRFLANRVAVRQSMSSPPRFNVLPFEDVNRWDSLKNAETGVGYFGLFQVILGG